MTGRVAPMPSNAASQPWPGVIFHSAIATLAWACGEEEYLQLTASSPPLHYNGAIGFFVLPVGRL